MGVERSYASDGDNYMRKKKYRKNYTEELQYFEKGWKKFWEKTQYTLEDIKSEVEDYGFSLIEKRYDRETNTTEYLIRE